jgi:hypothetical protein
VEVGIGHFDVAQGRHLEVETVGVVAGNEKALEMLRRILPAAWQHLHFLGHYTFLDKQHRIDLEAILEGVNLDF